MINNTIKLLYAYAKKILAENKQLKKEIQMLKKANMNLQIELMGKDVRLVEERKINHNIRRDILKKQNVNKPQIISNVNVNLYY